MYDVETIKSLISCDDIINLLGIDTRKSGKTTFIRCPEPTHKDEHIGSCRITENGYVCYACGKFGSSIDLYAKSKNISFGKAVYELGKSLDLKDEKIEICPLSSDDKEALGLKDCSRINKLWIEDKISYHLIISRLIDERISKISFISKKLERCNNNFLRIKDDETLWKLKNLCNEWLTHLKIMRCDYDEKTI